MHAHGKRGRKFGRKTDQRRALMRGLMCSLIEYQSITTTLARAKETRRLAEKLITMAKKGGLHNRRMIIARLNDLEVANLLIDVIAPQIKRDSGYLRIERAGYRRGDNAEMGTLSFVDEIDLEASKEAKSESIEKPVKSTKKPTVESKGKSVQKTEKKEDK